jgi:hypothetical protein
MNRPEQKSAAENSSRESADAKNAGTTGLPWLRTWRGVYVFVIGCFVLYVVLLAVLTRTFS